MSGLDSDFRRQPFEEITQLVAKAERITKLQAVCFCCYELASYSRRIDASNTTVEDIGGSDKYVACCRACFNKPIEEMHLNRNKEYAERLKLLQSK